MRIAIATDAWSPQINGVVTTLTQTRSELVAAGHDVLMLTPEGRRTMPCPTYPEIRLTLFGSHRIARELQEFGPDCIHVATEGPVGLAVRRFCIDRGLPFTTAYHTQFPEYVRARAPVPISWTAAWLRWFHGPATRTLVPGNGIREILQSRGFENIAVWSRGVDTDVFRPDAPFDYDLPRPIWIYAGRVAVEKNLGAFLGLDLPGSKVVVGNGPDFDELRSAFPNARFLGYRFGHELASCLAGADVFVFPSRTDTFGIVMLEAMACGLPVAAFPVCGPVDIVESGITGVLHDDLGKACRQALALDRNACVQFAAARGWKRCSARFSSLLATRSSRHEISQGQLCHNGRDPQIKHLQESGIDMARPKVFCIGSHKTGTTSLEVALKKLGYRVTGGFGTKDPDIANKVHEMAYALVERYDAFEDNPWPVLFRELDERFPGSKFILTRRPADAWIRSMVKDFATTETPMRRWIYGDDAGCPEGNEDIYIERYERHNRDVLEHFRDRPDDLLVFDLGSGVGWKELCTFLGHEIPDEPFPHANKASWSRKFKNWVKKLR